MLSVQWKRCLPGQAAVRVTDDVCIGPGISPGMSQGQNKQLGIIRTVSFADTCGYQMLGWSD